MNQTTGPMTRLAGAIDRRGFFWIGWASIAAASAGFLVSTFRFLVPNVLYEPPSRFSIGRPTDFPPGTRRRFSRTSGCSSSTAPRASTPSRPCARTLAAT